MSDESVSDFAGGFNASIDVDYIKEWTDTTRFGWLDGEEVSLQAVKADQGLFRDARGQRRVAPVVDLVDGYDYVARHDPMSTY